MVLGFRVDDRIELSNGLTVSGAYITFGKETLRLTPNSDGQTYTITCTAKLYASRNAYINNKQYIDVYTASEVINELQLNNNLYKRLYAVLKRRFVTTIDA